MGKMSDKLCQEIKKDEVNTEEVMTEVLTEEVKTEVLTEEVKTEVLAEEVKVQEVKTEEYKEEEGEESKVCRSNGDEKKSFTILEHMSVIKKMKEMTEQATSVGRSQKLKQEQKLVAKLKKAKTDTVEKLFKEGIFQKTDQRTTRCVSCSVTIAGGAGGGKSTKAAQKKRVNQLIVHLLGAKHRMMARQAQN